MPDADFVHLPDVLPLDLKLVCVASAQRLPVTRQAQNARLLVILAVNLRAAPLAVSVQISPKATALV